MVSLRLGLLALIRRLLRFRARPLIVPPGPLLVIAPHPDDETLGCGGLIQLCLRAGHTVHCLFLTDGSASHPGHPLLSPVKLAALRAQEATAATTLLGIKPTALRFLALPDGQLPHLSAPAQKQAITAIAEELTRLCPTVVLVAYRRDGSSEHEAAFPLVQQALADLPRPPRVLEYLVWTAYSPRLLWRALWAPGSLSWVFFPGLGAIKRQALAAYRSQFQPVAPWMAAVQPPAFAAAFSTEDEFFIESPL